MIARSLVITSFVYYLLIGFTHAFPPLFLKKERKVPFPIIPFLTPTMESPINFEFIDYSEEISCCLANDAPVDLQGTLFRNGPGLFSVGGRRIQHPFDGDGMVLSVSAKNGRLLFRNKLVRTEGYLKEQKAQNICYRGVFGTRETKRRGVTDMLPKNTANTHVLYWGKKLFALWECGRPYEINPQDLSTVGKSDCFAPLEFVGSHYKIDPTSGRLVLFASSPNPWFTKLQISEVDENFSTVIRHEVRLPRFAFFHDFAITDHYYLFFQSPLSFHPFNFLFGSQSIIECITFDSDRCGTLYLINRRDGTVEQATIPPCFSLHTVNAFEEVSKTKITFDLILTDSIHSLNDPFAPLQDSVGRSQMHRLELSRQSVSEQWKVTKIERLSGFIEFPSIHPNTVGKKHRYVYSLCGSNSESLADFRGISRIDCELREEERWIAPENSFLSEPIFATKTDTPTKNETDGYILTILSSSTEKTSELLIFEADKISVGPVHRSSIPVFLPPGLHGSFVPETS